MHRQRLTLLTDYTRKLLRRGARANILKVFARTHPADIAQILTALTEFEATTIIPMMKNNTRRAAVLCELSPPHAVALMKDLSDSERAAIISEMDTDDAASILDAMEEDETHRILEIMEEDDSLGVEKLLQYAEETAGRIMTPDFLAMHQDSTAEEAIETVRKAAETDMIFYLYVIDEHDHLLGVVSLRQLITARPGARLKDIMIPDVTSVRDTADQEEVAKAVARYDFLAIPVVNEHNQILGVVTIDDIVDVIKDEATEDILRLAGVDEQEFVHQSIGESARRRMFWLIVSLFGGLASASIIQGFEGRLTSFKGLVPFIPVIIGMGGNVGTQTVTIVVRGLGTGLYQVGQFVKVLLREMSIALILGVTFGGVVGIYGGFSEGALYGVAIAISMAMAMLVSTTVAVSAPMVFERLRIDPAIASGPFVTTSIDIIGLIIYFMTAMLILP